MKIFSDMIFDRNFTGLQKAMDLSWKRNEAIISNVTNAETPQYRAVDLDFAGELKKAFGQDNSVVVKTDPKHLDIGESGGSHLVASLSGATKGDGNNVDIDIEMGRLESNRGTYARAADLLRRKMRLLSTALRAIA